MKNENLDKLSVHEKVEQAKQMMNEEDTKPHLPDNNGMTLTQFKDELLKAHRTGRELTLKHRELMPMTANKKKNQRLGYHNPATNYDGCDMCKELIDAHNKFMTMQSDAFGITGIPYDNLMAAIKITEGILRLKDNETRL